MDMEELKVLSLQLRSVTGVSMISCRKTLAINDYDLDKSIAFLELYYWDSHGFRRTKEKHE